MELLSMSLFSLVLFKDKAIATVTNIINVSDKLKANLRFLQLAIVKNKRLLIISTLRLNNQIIILC